MDDQLLKILMSIAILFFTIMVGRKRKPADLVVPRPGGGEVHEEETEIPRELWDTEYAGRPDSSLESDFESDLESNLESEPEPNLIHRGGKYQLAGSTGQEAASLETLIGLETLSGRYDMRNAPAVSMFASVPPEEEVEVPLPFGTGSGFDLREAILYQTILERREI